MDKPIFIRDAGSTADKHRLAEFRCHCGKTFITMRCRVKEGVVFQCQACGRDAMKHKNTRHGGKGTPTYRTWLAMKRRCLNPDDKDYYRYGAKGITIYSPWINDFRAFRDYMGERPKDMTIDRIDWTKGYEPGNVRWATVIQQAENHSNIIFINWHGKPTRVKHIAKELGISVGAVHLRYKRGKLREPE
jgi:predicted RNA-binding Zn-ribbon protein involved in translation (DUF1610 family)